MNSRTVTAVFDAPKDRVFDFLADVDNLPKWADEFARELKHEGATVKVVNNLGEFLFRIDAHEETGVIDMYAGPTEEGLALFPTRVVALGAAKSAYSFTMFKSPGMPDELFESQYASLRREFDNIRARFAGEHVSCAQ